jgi:pimeloyl-ACP methyl ester carboxylesterase
VGRFIRDPQVRGPLVAQQYERYRSARPAFLRLNDDLLGTVFSRRRRRAWLRGFTPPVRIVFGARDRYLNPKVACQFAALFPNSRLRLLPDAGHYVQVDEPQRVAEVILDG